MCADSAHSAAAVWSPLQEAANSAAAAEVERLAARIRGLEAQLEASTADATRSRQAAADADASRCESARAATAREADLLRDM